MSSARIRCILSLTVLLSVSWAAAEPPAAPPQETPRPTQTLPSDELPDFTGWHPLHRTAYLSARRGAAWLWQTHRPDGLFQTGFNPANNLTLDDDHFLHQAAAAAALARSASVLNHPPFAVRAKQTMLSLLSQTKTDEKDPSVRWTMMPHASVNRVASASLLIQAISELPDPGSDLLEQMDQLAGFLKQQWQADGSIQVNDASLQAMAYHGWAVNALMMSHAIRPAAWKLDTVRQAANYYRSWFAAQKHPAPLPGLIAGFALAYRQTKDKAFAETALEMADFLARLQYPATFQPVLWQGGFATWREGQTLPECPTVMDACMLEGLIHAANVCKETGDLSRHERFNQALDRGMTFLMTLQFTQANTTHYADWYRVRITGAFQTSPQNGAVYMLNTPQATRALLAYVQAQTAKPQK